MEFQLFKQENSLQFFRGEPAIRKWDDIGTFIADMIKNGASTPASVQYVSPFGPVKALSVSSVFRKFFDQFEEFGTIAARIISDGGLS